MLFRLLTRRWGLLIIAAALIVGGLIWGSTSKQISYENSQTNTNYHIGTGDQTNNIYINADGSSTYFVALSSDFNPPISQDDIQNSAGISFVARTDTVSIDLQADDGTTVDEANPIEKLVFYDSQGNTMATYTTSEYRTNPKGFYDNEWLKAIWLIIVGALLGLGVLIAPLFIKKPQASAGFAANGQAYPSQLDPYGQQQQPPFNSYGGQTQQPVDPYGQQQPQQPFNPYGGQPQQPQQPVDPYGQQPYQQPYQGPQQYPGASQQPPYNR
jgi:hypothetical protein